MSTVIVGPASPPPAPAVTRAQRRRPGRNRHRPQLTAQTAGADVSRSVELFHRVNQQDFAACARCQLAAGSRAYADGGVLVPVEHHIAGFHEWVTAHLAAVPT